MNGHDTKRADGPREEEEDLIIEILDQLGAAVGAWNPPDGHCQHCALWCVALPPERSREPHESQFAQWMHGHCPACAERERITNLLAETLAAITDEARTTTSDTVRHRAQGASDTLEFVLRHPRIRPRGAR